MQTRALPHTDLTVSRACFGTLTFGKSSDEATARRIVDICLDRGINFFDTANAYNDGAAESMLGRILQGRRHRAVVASKVGFQKLGVPGEGGLSRAVILRNIDESLARLGTDYLDLYYLHVPDWIVPIQESLETMNELVRAGKVRYLACSNYAGWQVVQMLWLCERKGCAPPFVSQVMYNLLARGIEQEYLAMCREFGVSTVVYNPLAGGLLTGKQQRERPLPGTRFENNQLYLDRYWHPAYFDAVDELQAIAAREGRSLVDLALGWIWHHTAVDSVILGASTVAHLEQNLDAVEKGPLTPETVAACDAVWHKLRGITPNYNR
ncbi:MAG TPA: aldo/keto reductase [Bryobacteraceae bacterium]|nr:aldo/keto reductase [Bryobacteraceae bacterium]